MYLIDMHVIKTTGLKESFNFKIFFSNYKISTKHKFKVFTCKNKIHNNSKLVF